MPEGQMEEQIAYRIHAEAVELPLGRSADAAKQRDGVVKAGGVQVALGGLRRSQISGPERGS
jgi:hypothetical protein